MLQNIRDRLTGPFVWFIVGIIVIPFAFFGIETFRTGGGDPTVVKVGDQKITQSQFRAGYEQRMQQLQQLMGENFRPEMFDQGRFRQTVLDDMVQEALLRQHVRQAGYRASDAALFATLSSIPAFQEEGKFSSEVYRSRLAAQGYSPARFESQLRDGIEVDQMREGLLDSAFVPQAGAAHAFRVEHQQRWLAYAVFEAARYHAQVKVEPAQVQERYEQQKARYQSPERARVAYVELALDALPPAPAPEADYLRSIYEAEKAARFTTTEERRARHILINFGADKDAARQKAEALRTKIANGTDFGALAAAESQDPGSKGKGGDLGWVKRGQMVEKFEQALFGLNAGEVSQPVETEFGWHVVKLEELRAAQTRPFEDAEVQAQLLTLYRNRDVERRFQELSEKLEQTAFESPSSLEPAAKAVGIEIKQSDWFTREGGAGIAADAGVREAAFSEDVLQAGENSRPLSVGQNRIVVLRKHEHEPPRQKPLEEVAESIRTELQAEAAKARAESDAAAALEALNQGRPLEQIATEKKVALKAPGLVKRDAAGVDPQVLAAVFKLPRPAAGQATRERVALANGDVAVVVATEVQDADWATASEEDRRRMQTRLRESLAGAEFTAYRTDLQKRLEVKIINPPETEAEQPAS
jgi:peptidyl-prolyl cis-trans isomerase D